MLLSKENL
jgi:hypothetical protein